MTIVPHCDVGPERLHDLEDKMRKFYEDIPLEYYISTKRISESYSATPNPLLDHFISQLNSGKSLLEIGCGAAHFYEKTEAKGIIYTGADYSKDQLAKNTERFPGATFLTLDQIKTVPSSTFDFGLSLYVLEHTTRPLEHLNLLSRLVKPGGLVAVICPEFIQSECLSPSVFFGFTPRRLREKLQTLSFLDFLAHCCDLFRVRHQVKRILNAPPGSFYINLKPRVLYHSEWCSDQDAVCFTGLRDVRWWFENNGFSIEKTSEEFRESHPDTTKYSMYVLARKPLS